MRKTLIIVIVCLLTFSVSEMCRAQEAVHTVRLSKSDIIGTNNAVWEGWGTSLCWWANRIGYNPVLTDKAATLFFDAEQGLGLNIMRYNIGGGDDPSHHHITRTDSDVPGWLHYDALTGNTEYDYLADSCQLNVLEAAAKAAGQDAWIEVFSNSPPYFMTNSGCSTGNVKADENNLRDDSYGDFADYLAHVTAYMRNEMEIDVRSLAPMNEPNTNYWGAYSRKQEGCHFDAGESQSRILKLTSDAMKRYGIAGDVILTASDETNPGKQLEELRSYSADAKEAIGRISAHTYGINAIRELGQAVRDEGYNLWMSEVDGNGTSGTNAGEMAAGLWLAEKIIYDITELEPSAWVLWQVIDTHVSTSGYKGRRDTGALRLNGGYWGTAWADHDRNEIGLTQKYYAFGQFSRYIRPGAKLIKCQSGISGVSMLTALWKSGKGITVVCSNSTDTVQTIDVDLSDISIRHGRLEGFRTSGRISDGEHWSPIGYSRITRSVVRLFLAPNSVTTYVSK